LIQAELEQAGHTVSLVNAADLNPSDIGSYDFVLMGSPSWWNNNSDGQPHHLFLDLMKKMEGIKYTQKRFAVFGLGDSSYARVCGSVDHLEEFVKKLEGTLAVDSLRVDSFFFERDKNEHLIKEWAQNLKNHLS
jgi:flavodoxin